MVRVLLIVIGLLLGTAMVLILLGATGVIEMKPLGQGSRDMLLAVTFFSMVTTMLTLKTMRRR